MIQNNDNKPVSPKDLGWAKITHPFHPLYGKRFKILKIKKATQGDLLTLQGTHRGWFFVLRDWTDKADPSLESCSQGSSSILSFTHLFLIHSLIDSIENDKAKNKKDLDK